MGMDEKIWMKSWYPTIVIGMFVPLQGQQLLEACL